MFENYSTSRFYDEMMTKNNSPRTHYKALNDQILQYTREELKSRYDLTQQSLLREGITFTVYDDLKGTERTMPFDFVPKIIPHKEWLHIEKGLIQRVTALNMFLKDVYTDQQILKDGIVPRSLIVSSPYFHPQITGLDLSEQSQIFLAGIDLIRDEAGEYRILEDNLRNPSGLAYLFQNRYVMRKVFPEMFYNYSVRSLENQFSHLLSALEYWAPHHKTNPNVVLLTPGIFNSAYYEHSFLAQQMGIELVEGKDMIVIDRVVYMKTTRGLQQVDMIYRRIDDEFLDPLEFRSDSQLGVAGLVDAYRAGNVSIVNGLGNGVADDKAVYTYVPAIIEYYQGEKPILNNVPTYILTDEEQREHVLSHMDSMVVKPVDGSGGYGMLIGTQASELEIEEFKEKIINKPEAFIAQPIVGLSRIPTYKTDKFTGCHVDLRPFVIMGEHPKVMPGGLTRVSLKEGSLVVNSSQGGGSKDTWVLED